MLPVKLARPVLRERAGCPLGATGPAGSAGAHWRTTDHAGATRSNGSAHGANGTNGSAGPQGATGSTGPAGAAGAGTIFPVRFTSSVTAALGATWESLSLNGSSASMPQQPSRRLLVWPPILAACNVDTFDVRVTMWTISRQRPSPAREMVLRTNFTRTALQPALKSPSHHQLLRIRWLPAMQPVSALV